jgi:hypothetical protein
MTNHLETRAAEHLDELLRLISLPDVLAILEGSRRRGGTEDQAAVRPCHSVQLPNDRVVLFDVFYDLDVRDEIKGVVGEWDVGCGPCEDPQLGAATPPCMDATDIVQGPVERRHPAGASQEVGCVHPTTATGVERMVKWPRAEVFQNKRLLYDRADAVAEREEKAG